MHVMDDDSAPRKKPRLDPAADDLWGPDEEFPDEVFVQLDQAATQAYSQTGGPSSNHLNKAENRFQRHHSWAASTSETLPAQLHNEPKWQSLQTRSNNQKVADVPTNCQVVAKQKTNPLWSNVSSLNGQTVTERQKHELKTVNEAKLLLEEQVKTLQETVSKKDSEVKTTKQECIFLKQQCAALKLERGSCLQEISKLKTELKFKCQELASDQWKSTQQQQLQQQNRLNVKLFNCTSSGSQVKKQILKSPPKVVDDIGGFPSSASFSKCLALKNTGSPKVVRGRTAEVCDENHDSEANGHRPVELRVPRASGIESGSGLVHILLNETIALWPSRSALFKEDTTLRCFTNKSKLNTNKLNACGRSPKEFQKVDDDWCVELRLALSGLLEGAATVKPSGDIRRVEIPDDLSIFKTFVGLHHDSASALLPLIEDALKDELVTESHALTSSSDTCTSSSSASATVGVKSVNPDDPSVPTLQNAGNGMKAKSKESFRHTVALLRVLKWLVCYSSVVRHCLIQGVVAKSPGSAHTGPNSSPDMNSPIPGPSCLGDCSSQLQRNYSPAVVTPPCVIMKKLFTLCSMTYMEERKYCELLQVILEILKIVAAYCHISALQQFLPIMKTDIVQNCTSLTCSGSVFLQFTSLLCVLCCSKNIIEATCNQEDFCLWLPLSDGWQKAREELPAKQMLQLDNQMIKLLAQCMTLDDTQPPFLDTNECHCPFEVVSSVIFYLHKQQKLYETVGHLDSWPTLQKGITLLYQMVQQDAHFPDHRASMDEEMVAFLIWLPELQKICNLGPEADALMEMWSIGSDTT